MLDIICIVKEMQIKMRYHYIPTEVSNTDKTKYCLGDRVGTVVEIQHSETTFEDSLTVSYKMIHSSTI